MVECLTILRTIHVYGHWSSSYGGEMACIEGVLVAIYTMSFFRFVLLSFNWRATGYHH